MFGLLKDIFGNKSGTPGAGQSASVSEQSPVSDDVLMVVEEVFAIEGRGPVVVGKVNAGTASVGDRVTISSVDGEWEIIGLEAFNKQISSAEASTNVGMLFGSGLRKDQVSKGAFIKKI